MEIAVRNVNNWTVFDLSGNIRRKDAENLKKLCLDNLKELNKQIAVNFEKLDFIDSIGLGVLISCNTEVKAADGKFLLMNLSENIYDLLEMTSVDKMFTIIDSEGELP